MTGARVFLSAVSSELKSARQAVSATLRTLGFEPVSQDDFPTGPGELRRWLREQVESCEGLIQLVGEAYGAEPAEQDPALGRVSYTQLELLYAQQLKKKVWVIFAGQGCRRDRPPGELDLPTEPGSGDAARWQAERRALQEAWKQRLASVNFLRHSAANDVDLQNIVLRLRDELGELRRKSETRDRRLLSFGRAADARAQFT